MKCFIKYTPTFEDALERNLDLIRFSSSRRVWVVFGTGGSVLSIFCFVCLFAVFFYYEDNSLDYFGNDYGFALDAFFSFVYSGGISLAVYWAFWNKKRNVIKDAKRLATKVSIEAKERAVLFDDDFIQVDYNGNILKTPYSEITSVEVLGGTIMVYSNKRFFFMFSRYIQNHDIVDYFPKEKLRIKPKANYNIKRTYKPTIKHEKFPYQL